MVLSHVRVTGIVCMMLYDAMCYVSTLFILKCFVGLLEMSPLFQYTSYAIVKTQHFIIEHPKLENQGFGVFSKLKKLPIVPKIYIPCLKIIMGTLVVIDRALCVKIWSCMSLIILAEHQICATLIYRQ